MMIRACCEGVSECVRVMIDMCTKKYTHTFTYSHPTAETTVDVTFGARAVKDVRTNAKRVCAAG